MRTFTKTLTAALILFTVLPVVTVRAQSVGINFNGVSANSSSALDIDVNALATKKGLLIPRVTLAQRTAMSPLPAPAQGLLVYQTDGVEGLYYNTSLTTTPVWIYGSGNCISNGTTGQVAFFNGSNSIISNTGLTYNAPTGALTAVGTASGGYGIFGSNSSATNATVGVMGAASGNGSVSGVQGQATSSVTTAGAAGVSGFALGTTGATYGIYGQSNSSTGTGVYGWANAAQGVGVQGYSTTAGSAGTNFGVVGVANNNTSNSIGVDGETSTASMNAIRGIAYGATANTTGVFGVNTSTVGGAVNTFGVWAQNAPTAASSGTNHIGLYTTAQGAQYNAGLYVGGGETVITNSQTISATPQLPRSYGGSMFTQVASATATGGRIWYSSGGYIFYVNSSGSADYSEYFKTADHDLGVGEVVALDPNNSNGVRRARPSDGGATVGVVSIGGTRLNDNTKGNRMDDPNYVNIGMMGQVPVLVTTDNGAIKPGDALTLSSKYRGRVVKALGPCRIIGYATTHFPYQGNEQDYEFDILGGDKMRLSADHVMCYLNVGWYAPTTNEGDGIELPKVESARAMMKRLSSTLVSPEKAAMEQRENSLKQTRKPGPIAVQGTLPAASVGAVTEEKK